MSLTERASRTKFRAVYPWQEFPTYMKLKPKDRGRKYQAITDLQRGLHYYVQRKVTDIVAPGLLLEWVSFTADLFSDPFSTRRAPDGSVWAIRRVWVS